MDLGIAGKVALVTGGSRGLGRQAALSLAREGANVAICARKENQLEETVRELESFGGRALGVAGDVTAAAECENIHRKVVEKLGAVDILVNNVGGSKAGTVLSASDEDWQGQVNINVMPAVRFSRLAVPEMQRRRWGRIINVASVWGREYGGNGSYMATKAALIALTKHLAVSLVKDGVLVNSVAPGSVTFPGGSWDRFQKSNLPETVQAFIEQNLPMGRFGWPEPVGDLIAFLASDRAGFLTGACINIDGGQTRSMI